MGIWFVKVFKYIFFSLLAVIISASSVFAVEAKSSQPLVYTVQLDEFIKIAAVDSPVLTANITDRTGNLYVPMVSRFKVLSNSGARKTLYLKANTVTQGGNEEAMFDLGGKVYIAFANLEKIPTHEALANCKYATNPESSPGVVAYPINSILGAKYKYDRAKGKYEIYIESGITNINVNVGQHVLINSFASNDPNGFYQATLSLTESEI